MSHKFSSQLGLKKLQELQFNHVLLALSSAFILAMFYNHFQGKLSYAPHNSVSNTPASPENQTPFASATPAAASVSSVSQLVNDAIAFKNLLSTSQQSSLQLTYTTTLAKKWSNLPCGTSCRNGVQLGTNLTAVQYAAAMLVIKDVLSAASNDGYDEFHQMNLAEAYLHANGGASGYDSTLRWMAFLNNPTATGPWMLQFGGHHYAANISFNNGHIIGATPYFMGLEPKTFTYNNVNYDPLGDERDAFTALFASLSSTELAAAHLTTSFSDCAMIPGESNGGTGTFPATPVGISCGSLTSTQQNMVLDVIKHYVNDLDSASAAVIMAVYASEIANTYIAYTGSGTSGNPSSFLNTQGNYVRIDGPSVWVEFSCQGGIVIQNQIHYHTVWRDQLHDYGVNLTGGAIDSTSATNIVKIKSNESLAIFPNPATDKISLQLNTELINASMSIIQASTGQAVKSNERFSGRSYSTDISMLSSGIYLVRVQSNNNSFYTGRFTKK
jgi:hypothetical protein